MWFRRGCDPGRGLILTYRDEPKSQRALQGYTAQEFGGEGLPAPMRASPAKFTLKTEAV